MSALARSSLHLAFVSAGLLAACGLPEDEETFGTHESAVSVAATVTSSCSTAVVLGLSKQIADEIGCMGNGALVKFSPSANLQITSSAVLPYLNATAKTRLQEVAATRVVRINSAFRTVAQQYLLYRWDQLGRCGIAVAAAPGRSNHEGGRALDVGNYSSLISAMANKGWAHNVPGDPVHFEFLSAPDIRGRDVLAFQKLHNRNNPNDKISEDGAYGPQTEARLKAAPATGFAQGASCMTNAIREQPADVVQIDGPDKLAPGAKAKFKISLNNTGEVDWPATTKILVADGGTSQLYDSATWRSAREVGTIGLGVPANEMGVIELSIAAPMVSEETPLFTQFVLENEGVSFGTLNIGVTVTPNGDEDTSAEADDMNDDGAVVTGGCNAGGSSSSWLLALALGALVLRRRRG
jgi:uncharacterized protein (TIGR03382 family)